jgi:hypothetical protein
MPELYPLVAPYGAQKTAQWDFSKWQPDIVVVNLGTNDFAVSAPDEKSYVGAVVDFIRFVRGKYSAAKIVMLDGPMLNDFWPEGVKSRTINQKYLAEAVKILESKGIKNLFRFSFEPQNGSLGYGADWHCSERQALKNGKELAEFLRGI